MKNICIAQKNNRYCTRNHIQLFHNTKKTKKMAYNPKGALKTLTQKDVSKKDIQKLGKKAVDAATAQPFFICANHKFPDGKEGALFLFGKLAKIKAEIKTLKGPEHLHGVAFVTTDDKGKTTLNLLPSKGKLDSKEAILKKAMKEAFTPAFAEFKIGAPISEEDAEKLAEAAEKLEDIADEPEVAAAASEAAPAPDKKDDGGAGKLIGEVADFLKGKAKDVIANIKAKSATDNDKSLIEEAFSKIDQLKGLWKSLPDPVKATLAKAFDQIAGQFPALEKVREALKGLGNGKEDDNDLEKFLKKIANGINKIGSALDKAVDGAKNAVSSALPKGADLLKKL